MESIHIWTSSFAGVELGLVLYYVVVKDVKEEFSDGKTISSIRQFNV